MTILQFIQQRLPYYTQLCESTWEIQMVINHPVESVKLSWRENRRDLYLVGFKMPLPLLMQVDILRTSIGMHGADIYDVLFTYDN